MAIILCNNCVCGVVNDDWTHLDYGQDGTDETARDIESTYARIRGTLELSGWLVQLSQTTGRDYFECALCWEIQCGGGTPFYAEKQLTYGEAALLELLKHFDPAKLQRFMDDALNPTL